MKKSDTGGRVGEEKRRMGTGREEGREIEENKSDV